MTATEKDVDNSTVERASPRQLRHRRAGKSTSTTPSTSGRVRVNYAIDERASPRRQRHRRTSKSATSGQRPLRRRQGKPAAEEDSPRGPWSAWSVVRGLWSVWSVASATSAHFHLYTTTPLRRPRRQRSLQTSSRHRPHFTAILANSFDHLYAESTIRLRTFVAAVILLEVFGDLSVIL